MFASAFVQQYLTGRMVARWMPRRPFPAVVVSSLLGLVVPVCDCGAIPFARRLAAKGVPAYAAVSFLLAAPVVNPAVLASTAVAFQGNAGIVALRMGMTLSVAIAVGLLASALFPRAGASLAALAASLDSPDQVPAFDGRSGRLLALVCHVNAEYFDIIFFIVLGALFTAAAQTLIPRGDLMSLGSQPAGSVLALMPVATLLSICSEADAFIARAFAASFSLGAVLAFMTIGQLVDLRNGLLLLRTVGIRPVLLIVLVSYALVFAEGVAINRLVPTP